jgi:hypothetical protein
MVFLTTVLCISTIFMAREKYRKLHCRQRRRRKLQKLKKRLAAAANIGEPQYLVEEIRRITLNPEQDVPEKFHDLLGNS